MTQTREPQYKYFKGVGWQVTTQHYPEISRLIGKYMVTCIKKTPEPGDRYFEQYRGVESSEIHIMDAMQDVYWTKLFATEPPDRLLGCFPLWTALHKTNNVNKAHDLVVVKFELVQ